MLDAVEADMKGTSELLKDEECKGGTNTTSSAGEKDMVHDVGLKEDRVDGPLDRGVLPPPGKELGIQGLLDAFVDSKEEKHDGFEGKIAL